MIFFDKTRTIGQDANGKNVVWVSIYVDTAANLPAYNDYQSGGFILCMASEGRCIDTGDLYRLDSAGTWQITQAGTGTYTKSEIDALLNAKQDVLTFDNTPTENSTNPVTSGGIWTDQQRQETEIGVVANAGAKNFAVPFNPISTTDIAVTQNVDGSYTFVCTNVSENRVIRVANIGDLPSGAYKFSGTTGGSSSTYMLGLYNTSSTAVKYQHTNAEETYTGNVTGFSVRVRVIAGYSGTFTVYPMLRPAAITDQTFQPYALPNPTLTPAVIKALDEGAKNKLDATPNSDTGWIDINVEIPSGDYVLFFGNLTSTDTDATTCQLALFNKDMQNILGIYPQLERGNDIVYRFTILEASKTLRVYASRNSSLGRGDTVTVTNAMICTAQDWAVSQKFVPYRPSWQEMYEMILALQ